ncbi:uncharacterized protein [Miscanthus floridulus]|uniref:uncharacterized protein n=1 Tax=Miscanthus floridulus TaxID=154761 RepID=UPI00345AC35C
MEQPAPTSGDGSLALVQVRLEPHGWDHPRVLWQSRDDPEGEPLFTLEDAAEGGALGHLRAIPPAGGAVTADSAELETRSLRKSLFLRWERDIWDQLQRQKGLLADANEVLSARSMEVEDLRLRYANMKVEAAMAQEQVAPLVARVKELEEKLTRVADDWDAFRSWAEEATASAKALTGQLGAEQELEKEVTRAAEASIVVQAVLEAEIWEHDTLKSATRTVCEALEVEGAQSGSSLKSRLVTLSGQVHERLRGVLHAGVKHALAVISSHYAGVDLETISDSYVLPEDNEEADEEVTKLMDAAEGPGTALARLFEEEVVPPLPSANARDPDP